MKKRKETYELCGKKLKVGKKVKIAAIGITGTIVEVKQHEKYSEINLYVVQPDLITVFGTNIEK